MSVSRARRFQILAEAAHSILLFWLADYQLKNEIGILVHYDEVIKGR